MGPRSNNQAKAGNINAPRDKDKKAFSNKNGSLSSFKRVLILFIISVIVLSLYPAIRGSYSEIQKSPNDIKTSQKSDFTVKAEPDPNSGKKKSESGNNARKLIDEGSNRKPLSNSIPKISQTEKSNKSNMISRKSNTSSMKSNNSSKSEPQTSSKRVESPVVIDSNSTVQSLSELEKAANEAWATGHQAWLETIAEIQKLSKKKTKGGSAVKEKGKNTEECVSSIMRSGDDIRAMNNMVFLPCGMNIGSSITVIGSVNAEMSERDVFFHLELQGLRVVDGEDPPRIYHFNPRLKGDWSGNPIIEQNTCYRGQWGVAQRCEGMASKEGEEKVDYLRRCEKWSVSEPGKGKTSAWLQRFLQRSSKEDLVWPFPFENQKTSTITLRAGWEGFHIFVDGNHITSFPYRTGFLVEEATGFHIGGYFSIDSFIATGLPSTPPPQYALLESSDNLKAPPAKKGEIQLYIGVLSSSNHFEERLAVRKTWMQYPLVRSGDIIVRFFVGLHPSKLVNMEVMKEAELYGDMVILKFIDRYDLVVLKTIAILEYGVNNVSSNFIMKADDDNFVRIQKVLVEINYNQFTEGLYMGNINEFHKPLREGKWAVTEEEWPETNYPPYANGPGYIVTRDIAEFVTKLNNAGELRIFKMEDVSMGMWVVQFGVTHTIHYVHNWKFCQFGCLEDYITAHYQSPRQMVCMWGKLSHGEARCCND